MHCISAFLFNLFILTVGKENLPLYKCDGLPTESVDESNVAVLWVSDSDEQGELGSDDILRRSGVNSIEEKRASYNLWSDWRWFKDVDSCACVVSAFM